MTNLAFGLQGALWGLLLVYPSLRSLYRLRLGFYTGKGNQQ